MGFAIKSDELNELPKIHLHNVHQKGPPILDLRSYVLLKLHVKGNCKMQVQVVDLLL